MSLFGQAIAGAADATYNLSNRYIDESLAEQRAQALADIQRNSQFTLMKDTDAYQLDPTRQANVNAAKVAEINATGTATNAVNLQGQVALAQNGDITSGLAARAKAEAIAKSQGTDKDVAPGGQVFRDGVMVEQNTRPTGAEVTRDAYAAGLKGGPTSKADHFDAKEWDAAQKIEPGIISFTDPASGKLTESPELSQVYRNRLNELHNQGNYSPNEAAAMARDDVTALRNAATDMVTQAKAADKNSPLTEITAARKIMDGWKAAQAAARASAAAAQSAGPPNTAYGNETQRALSDVAAGTAPAAAPAASGIPAPPPQFGFNGNARMINPAFTAWEAQYGPAANWKAQTDSDGAAQYQRARALIDQARQGGASGREFGR